MEPLSRAVRRPSTVNWLSSPVPPTSATSIGASLVGIFLWRKIYRHGRDDRVRSSQNGQFLQPLPSCESANGCRAESLTKAKGQPPISSGSAFAVIAASRLSVSKNPNCPIVPTRESCCYNSDSHKSAEPEIVFADTGPFVEYLARGPPADVPGPMAPCKGREKIVRFAL